MTKRLTIGFLDEDAYDEYHNMLAQGVARSAREHDVNVIRFGHFMVHFTTTDPRHVDMLQQFVRQFDLDGLLFLGWARGARQDDLKRLFGDLPMVSVGSSEEGIPGVYFPGDHYIRDIAAHLVEKHAYRNIAFIEPFWPDTRIDAYLQVMHRHKLATTVVQAQELSGLSVRQRGRRAVQILLDERQMDLDAIMSLTNEESFEIIEELKRRKIRVPEDIAVTSYENGDVGRFSDPAVTTVDFPWAKLGYESMETLYRLLSGETIPAGVEVTGQVIYRNSCGCMPHEKIILAESSMQSETVPLQDLADERKDEMARQIAAGKVYEPCQIRRLIDLFQWAWEDPQRSRDFLLAFERLLRPMSQQSQQSDYEKLATDFRYHLLPCCLAQDEARTVRAEDIFLQMQIYLQHRLATIRFREDFAYSDIKKTLKEVGQILITHLSVDSLMNSLVINLPRIGIESGYVYLFDPDQTQSPFSAYRLALAYRDGRRVDDLQHVAGQEAYTAKLLDMKKEGFKWPLESVLFDDDRPHFLLGHLLYMGDDFNGFILLEPEHMDLRIYRTLGLQISTALNEIRLFEKLDVSYRQLMDQAHQQGMADTTGTLHNIGNLLSSIHVSIQELEKLLQHGALHDFRQAGTLLAQNMEDLERFVKEDPRALTLMRYFVSLSDEMLAFRNTLQAHVKRLLDRIGLIEEIVESQQSHAAVATNLAKVELKSIVKDALALNQKKIEDGNVSVKLNLKPGVTVWAQKTKLFHVLTNVIQNALESMQGPDGRASSRELVVTMQETEAQVTLRVHDQGPGIPQDKLESIFAYGYTTKEDGHGFGLHSCANYMRDMKGRIWAENRTDKKGAVFVLQFKAASS